MCGRYKLELPFREIVRLYNLTQANAARFDNMPARYNIAPTQEVAVVRLDAERHREFVTLRWGLIPYWSKDAKSGFSTINAMSETVDTKPAFREPFAKRRCLVLADGFYEWVPTGEKSKQPFLIRMQDQSAFAFAGLWDRWRDKASGTTIESCTIITVPPNDVCAPIHDRMPAILAREDYAAWLGEVEGRAPELKNMLKPCPMKMETVPISTKVNNVKNEGRGLVATA